MSQDDFGWIAPVLGFIGLLAGTLFFSNQQPNKISNGAEFINAVNKSQLPPPPNNVKPVSNCGCNKKV